jgi:sugar lactone lactonase YvrE
VRVRLSVAAVALLSAAPAFAHLVVDVGVTIRAPAFVTSRAALQYKIDVTDLAYDSAFGVVVTNHLPSPAKYVSSSGSGWNCSASGSDVTCSAETLTSGVSTITINATAPASSGTLRDAASVESLGSFDPVRTNDSTSADTIVYDAAACTSAAPSLTAPVEEASSAAGTARFTWDAVPGAKSYRLFGAVEGAKPASLAESSGTTADVPLDPGWTEWWVEAAFNSCPPTTSSHRHVHSSGAPHMLYLTTWTGRAETSGIDDGRLPDATFRAPSSLGADVYGTMYVLDAEASTLRVIAAGEVGTVAGEADQAGWGDASGSFAQMNHPAALSVSAGGYAYIADTGNDVIRQFYPNGNGVVFGPILLTIAGAPGASGTTDGEGGKARFSSPAAIAVAPDYTLFIADTANHRIRKLLNNTVSTVAGGSPGSADGPRSSAQFRAPQGIAVDGDGNVYVADTDNDTIRKLAADGMVSTIAGAPGVADFADGLGTAARFKHPTGLTLDALGNLWVADSGNNAIRRIAPSGLVTTMVGGSAGLNDPRGIAFDAARRLFIADRGNHMVRLATTTAPAVRRRTATH